MLFSKDVRRKNLFERGNHMRDFIVIVFVFALVIAGYFGYKEFFGEKVDVPAAQAGEQQTPAAPAAAPAPAPAEPAASQPRPAVDPEAAVQQRVVTGRSPDMAGDLYYLARNAAARGEAQKSLGYMRQIHNEYPDSPYSHIAASVLAEAGLAQGRKWEARNFYSFAYDHTTDAETRKGYAAKMDELNDYLVFGPAGSRDSVVHQVQPGDVLSKLAAKYNCPYRLIMKINNISDPTKLRVGQRVKILADSNGGQMKMSILIDKSEFRLTLYLNGYFLREYHVGIGQHDFTPVGEFTVGERLEKPEWRGHKHGDPKNILGEYWITLENSNYPGLGIHGTTEPESIGTRSSLGCIRMYNKEVGELFIMVPKGTKVNIRE